MGTQLYYQNPGKDGTSAAPPASVDPPLPLPLRWLAIATAVYTVLLVALPIQMTLDQEALTASIRENNPDLNPAHMDFAINAALVYSWALHAIDVVLTIWFTVKAVRGRRWARIALTGYLLIATSFSLVSAAAGTMYLWAVISCDGIHVLMLVLLWAPRSVRRFFATHRAKSAIPTAT